MGQWGRGVGWTCRLSQEQGFDDEFDLGETESAVKQDLQPCSLEPLNRGAVVAEVGMAVGEAG